VNARPSERGVALVFALATLTLVAITIAAVASQIQSRGAGVAIGERSVRLVALSDAAMAETLAELADRGAAFGGIRERSFPGGSIASSVRPLGEWEAEVIAVGVRDGWQSAITARVSLHGAPRVVWWQRTQSPIPAP
jgi:hypothetical protein